MRSHQGEEMVLMFGFNKYREIEIQGYLRPQKGKFTQTELQSAYIAASKDNGELTRDRKAAALFQDFRRERNIKETVIRHGFGHA
jgi:type II secretory pathway component PulC